MLFNEYRDQLRQQEDDGCFDTNIDSREDQLFIVQEVDGEYNKKCAVVYRKFGLWRAPKSINDWGDGNLFIGSLPYVMDGLFNDDHGCYETYDDLLKDYATVWDEMYPEGVPAALSKSV
jgi:hypothetical protein